MPVDGAHADGPARVLLRPEQLRLSAPARRGSCWPAWAASTSTATTPASGSPCPDGTAVTARLDGADLPATGAYVAVTVRGSALAFPATADRPLQPGRLMGPDRARSPAVPAVG